MCVCARACMCVCAPTEKLYSQSNELDNYIQLLVITTDALQEDSTLHDLRDCFHSFQ